MVRESATLAKKALLGPYPPSLTRRRLARYAFPLRRGMPRQGIESGRAAQGAPFPGARHSDLEAWRIGARGDGDEGTLEGFHTHARRTDPARTPRRRAGDGPSQRRAEHRMPSSPRG